MNAKVISKFTLFIALGAMVFVSCGKNNQSRATGWSINSKKGGFQYNVDFEDQETGPGLVFIEGGTFTKGQVQDDVLHDWNNAPTRQHVMSFYIDETEVTNLMYLEYLNWLQLVFPTDNPQYRQIYEGALPDTLVWRNQLGYVEELTTNYLRHPAYAEYPVVGVNWLQAVQFAEWRTDRVNEFILEREAFIEKDVRYNEIDANSTFSTSAYLKLPESTYGGKIDSLVGKNGRQKKIPQKSTSMLVWIKGFYFLPIDCPQKPSGNMQHLPWVAIVNTMLTVERKNTLGRENTPDRVNVEPKGIN